MNRKAFVLAVGGVILAGAMFSCDSENFEDAPRARAPDEPLVSKEESRERGRRMKGSQVPARHPPVGGEETAPGAGSQSEGTPSEGSPGGGAEPKAGDESAQLPVTWEAPSNWKKERPSSSMRKAQYRLPGADGAGAATLAIFHFPGSRGKTQANIDRWVGQFEPPEGRTAEEVAETETRTVDGVEVHIVRTKGTYQGMGNTEPKEDYRLLAAIVKTKKGPVFFKLVGPARTVASRSEEFQEFVGSFRVESQGYEREGD